MKGGLNKIMRNINATLKGQSSQFSQSLMKATYEGDIKEPKEKHVVLIIECLTSMEHRDLIDQSDAILQVC